MEKTIEQKFDDLNVKMVNHFNDKTKLLIEDWGLFVLLDLGIKHELYEKCSEIKDEINQRKI